MDDEPQVTDVSTAGEPGWRRAADVVAAAVCVAAIVWSFGLAERVPLLAAVDLGIHELGHLLLGWAPGLLPPLAGSLLQLGVPLALAAYFGLARREAYAAAVLLAWAGTSAQNVSVYVADAPYERLPLIGGMHDWAWILASTQRISWAAPLAGAVWLFGLGCCIGGIAVALWPFAAAAREKRRAEAERARLASLPRREPRNPVQS